MGLTNRIDRNCLTVFFKKPWSNDAYSGQCTPNSFTLCIEGLLTKLSGIRVTPVSHVLLTEKLEMSLITKEHNGITRHIVKNGFACIFRERKSRGSSFCTDTNLYEWNHSSSWRTRCTERPVDREIDCLTCSMFSGVLMVLEPPGFFFCTLPISQKGFHPQKNRFAIRNATRGGDIKVFSERALRGDGWTFALKVRLHGERALLYPLCLLAHSFV